MPRPQKTSAQLEATCEEILDIASQSCRNPARKPLPVGRLLSEWV